MPGNTTRAILLKAVVMLARGLHRRRTQTDMMNMVSHGRRAVRRVVAIGLDSVKATLLSKWIDAGALPEIAAVTEASARGRLVGTIGYTAETPWTNVLTACWPTSTACWTPLNYSSDYRGEEIGA